MLSYHSEGALKLKNTLMVICLVSFLSACGGDSHTSYSTTDSSYKPEVTEPVIIPPESVPPGYQDDGTLTPPTEEPEEPSSPLVQEKPQEGPQKPCRAPQASEQGVANGKPPVGRCEA